MLNGFSRFSFKASRIFSVEMGVTKKLLSSLKVQFLNYSGDPNSGHLVNGNIRLMEFTIAGKKSVNPLTEWHLVNGLDHSVNGPFDDWTGFVQHSLHHVEIRLTQ